ncbi:hypothetical protein [Pseudoduganella violaceinigra]|uniref:hypothetical protein n=1 Tax=Pseudoduganella violaceinigra TaxID=246602 RepID=UPI000428C5C5|nr:hypothetical protein [Pseudoduganella violaceinigra]
MKKTRLAAILACALLTACGSGPRVPDWQMNAASATERAGAAYLEGRSAIAEREFALARSQVGSTGQPALAIRVELLRCAVQVAALVFDECAGFTALQPDATPADLAYARYLAGKAAPADAAQLPEPQRAVAAASSDTGAATAAAAIGEPLSRLVAAGALLRANRATPALVAMAIDTASAQGWRRPLLAWLNIQLQRAEKAGDMAEAERLRRRIKLASTP